MTVDLKPKFINLYMDWAHLTAKLSHARRLQVGAVIVKDDCVISHGYNGMPAGWDNNCETVETTFDEQDTHHSNDWHYDIEKKQYYRLKTKPEVIHAESNAIAKLARSSNSGVDADIFVSHAPCIECSKLILQSGIRRVFFRSAYRDNSGIEFLQKSGITVTQT